MVEIFQLASTPHRPQLKPQLNQGRLCNDDTMMGPQQVGGGLVGIAAESEGEDWSDSFSYPAAAGSPAMCMMWCAVALGSLVKGAPVENVSRSGTALRLEETSSSRRDCFVPSVLPVPPHCTLVVHKKHYQAVH